MCIAAKKCLHRCNLTAHAHTAAPPGRVAPGALRRASNRADERIVGTTGNDVIVSAGGEDDVNARAGRDCVFSNDGDVDIDGGNGGDLVATGDGDDEADAGDGADRVVGGHGRDRLSGGRGGDRVTGNAGNDRLSGQRGRDVLSGGSATTGARTQAGRTDGHQRGETMTATGENRWPPPGRTQWPLTLLGTDGRLLGDMRRPSCKRSVLASPRSSPLRARPIIVELLLERIRESLAERELSPKLSDDAADLPEGVRDGQSRIVGAAFSR
jgi:hypothetical protein